MQDRVKFLKIRSKIYLNYSTKQASTPANKDLQFFGVYDGHTTHLIAELIANKLDQYIINNLKNDDHIPSAIKKCMTLFLPLHSNHK